MNNDAQPVQALTTNAMGNLLWQAHRHRRRMHNVRNALLFTAGTVFAAGILFTLIGTLASPGPQQNTRPDMEDGQVVMGAPRLQGRNSDNQPYRIEAESALQSPDDLDRLQLKGISGDLPLGSNARIVFQSDAGFYDSENQYLDFLAPLRLETSAGETALMQDGRIDLLAGSFTSDNPVRLTTETATLTADSVRVDSRTRNAIFKGSVRVRIVPDDVRPQDAQSQPNVSQQEQRP